MQKSHRLGYSTISPGVYFKAADHYLCTGESKQCASFKVMTGDASVHVAAVTVSMYKKGVSDSIGTAARARPIDTVRPVPPCV